MPITSSNKALLERAAAAKELADEVRVQIGCFADFLFLPKCFYG